MRSKKIQRINMETEIQNILAKEGDTNTAFFHRAVKNKIEKKGGV